VINLIYFEERHGNIAKAGKKRSCAGQKWPVARP